MLTPPFTRPALRPRPNPEVRRWAQQGSKCCPFARGTLFAVSVRCASNFIHLHPISASSVWIGEIGVSPM